MSASTEHDELVKIVISQANIIIEHKSIIKKIKTRAGKHGESIKEIE